MRMISFIMLDFLFGTRFSRDYLWIGKSAGFDTNKMLLADDQVEKLCDQIAEFLVPKSLFESAWASEKKFANLARRFKVSTLVIARRALDLRKISKSQFFQWYNQWLEEKRSGDFYNYQPG